MTNLNVVRSGSGPLIICLHGIGGSAQTFAQQHIGLASEFEVVSYDAPGYGSSADPAQYPGTEGYIEPIARLIHDSGRQSAYLLGMSWGGVVAMCATLTRPELVAGLILGDSTRGSGQSPQQAAAMKQRPSELAEFGAAEFARRRAHRLLSSNADEGERELIATTMAESIRLPGYGYAAKFMAETDLTGSLSAIEAPTLVLYGADDVITGRAESQAIATEISGAGIQCIDNAGHIANQEQPTVFNSLVRGFISNT